MIGYGKKLRFIYWIGLLLICPMLSQCAYRYRYHTKDGKAQPIRYHILAEGETLWRISKRYNVPLEEIIRYNNIEDVTNVPSGERIYLPSQVNFQLPVDNNFVWPLQGAISRGFKDTGIRRHLGVDILAPVGSDIMAVAPGKVIYNGNKLAGYGNMIIIEHDNGLSSVYAHNKVNLVKAGEVVAQGQVIGKVGMTGRTSGAHLHFELRKDESPVDPKLFLPMLRHENVQRHKICVSGHK